MLDMFVNSGRVSELQKIREVINELRKANLSIKDKNVKNY